MFDLYLSSKFSNIDVFRTSPLTPLSDQLMFDFIQCSRFSNNAESRTMTPFLEEENLIRTALQKFEEQTGFAGNLIEQAQIAGGEKRRRPDAWVEIHSSTTPITFVAETKRNIGRVWTLEDVKSQLKAYNAPGLLIARYLTPELARQCKNLGLQFLDTAGNAYINEPGMFIQITGQRPEVDPWEEAPTFKGFTPTGLKILYAFTCNPDLLNAPLREIAKAADVGLGTVADILADLRKQGFVVKDENQDRRLFNLQQLRQAWTDSYPNRLRVKLQGRRFAAMDPEWWKEARPREQGAYWGSEVAAAKLTGYLVPQTCTLYTHEDPKALILRYRLRPDPAGTIEILKAYWNPDLPQGPPPHEDVVHPLLVVADLKAIDDPRTNETARMIQDRFLA
jgi:hypothetical protein